VFACFSVDEMEMQLRVFCVTDDGLDKTLERYQNYHEMARTQHVHVRCIFLWFVTFYCIYLRHV